MSVQSSDQQKAEPVFTKCNVSRPGGRCPGKQAIIVSRTARTELGGQMIQYQCTTCKGSWTLTY